LSLCFAVEHPKFDSLKLAPLFATRGVNRLPNIEGEKPVKNKFAKYPIGYFHIYIAEEKRESFLGDLFDFG